MNGLTRSTSSIKPGEVTRKWWLIDAEGAVLGRLASQVALLLRGKHKQYYTPHVDCGDRVIIVNAEKVRLTGKKRQQKRYHRHTGYSGGIKTTTAAAVLEGKYPERVIEHAVAGMLPKGPLARSQLKGLRVYGGSEHPHGAQMPELFPFAQLNAKNVEGGRDLEPFRSLRNSRQSPQSSLPARDAVPELYEVDRLLMYLDNPDERVRANASLAIARCMLLPDTGTPSRHPPMPSGLRRLPSRLMQGLIESSTSEVAGRAAALALVCFLYPERWRGADLERPDERQLADDLKKAFKSREVQFYTVVSIEDRNADGARVLVQLCNAFGFHLNGQLVRLDTPDWFEREKGLEVDGSGVRIRATKKMPAPQLNETVLAACEAEIAPLPDHNKRVSIYLRNGETVFDRYTYNSEELFLS